MPDKPKDPIAHHLEFLGYQCHSKPDDWVHCEHPKRFNLSYRKFPFGWRLHSAAYLGRTLGDVRHSLLDGLNALNEKSIVVKFSLNRDADGDFFVRARAYFNGVYSRTGFGVFMDVWHSDLEMLSELPTVREEAESPDEEEDAPAENARVVN